MVFSELLKEQKGTRLSRLEDVLEVYTDLAKEARNSIYQVTGALYIASKNPEKLSEYAEVIREKVSQGAFYTLTTGRRVFGNAQDNLAQIPKPLRKAKDKPSQIPNPLLNLINEVQKHPEGFAGKVNYYLKSDENPRLQATIYDGKKAILEYAPGELDSFRYIFFFEEGRTTPFYDPRILFSSLVFFPDLLVVSDIEEAIRTNLPEIVYSEKDFIRGGIKDEIEKYKKALKNRTELLSAIEATIETRLLRP